MRKLEISIVQTLLFMCSTFALAGQVHERFEGWCETLRKSSPPELVRYLEGVVANEANAHCVAWTINKLGTNHYEPAIPSLVRLLDFRRPPTESEKIGFYDRPQILEERFPAAQALETIGKNSLPELTRAIAAGSTSETARENAVAVWMEIYKYERPQGIALLKQEQNKRNGNATKQRFEWATQKALKYCAADEQTACRQAAAIGPA